MARGIVEEVQDDVCACFVKEAGGVGAKALAGAGDDCGFAVEVDGDQESLLLGGEAF